MQEPQARVADLFLTRYHVGQAGRIEYAVGLDRYARFWHAIRTACLLTLSRTGNTRESDLEGLAAVHLPDYVADSVGSFVKSQTALDAKMPNGRLPN